MMNTMIRNDWSGWLALDARVSKSNTYQYANNIDVRRKQSGICLSAKNQNEFSTNGLVTVFEYIYAFTDTGRIYDEAWNLVYTMTSSQPIYAAKDFDGYMYFTINWYLCRVSNGDMGSSWTNVDEDYIAINSGKNCFLEYEWELLVSDLESLKKLDTSTNSLETIFTLDERIIGIFEFATNVIIYTNKWKKYIWDGKSTYPHASIDMDKYNNIRAVINQSNNEYVLTGSSSDLTTSWIHLISGYEKILLAQALNRDDLFEFAGHTSFSEINCLGVWSDLLFVPSAQWIYSFGRFLPNQDNIWNLDWAISNTGIGAMKVDNKNLYLSYKTASANYVHKIDITWSPSTYMDNGEMISLIYDGDNIGIDKIMRWLKISFDKLNTGEKIEVFAKINKANTWWDAILTIDYADTQDRDITSKALIGPRANIGEWKTIEFKIKLTSGTSNLTTPIVHELQMDWEAIKI